jgi:crotonobetainyl-CoA:carnitine CoA-transferase CaiB-like acyl-CoA transferase
MARLPLEGIRVVTISVVYAGPFVTQLLGDWGAEVIRVESLHHFTSLTRGPVVRPSKASVQAMRLIWTWYYAEADPKERPWNRYPIFQSHARNKLGCTMDLRQPKGQELFKRLVKTSDIVVENNATGTMEKLGLDYEALREVKPDIIMLRMPGLGLAGPYSGYRTYGSMVDEIVGHHWLRRYPDMDPSMTTGVVYSDGSAGVHGAFACLMALRHRNRTGKGQFIELAQAETLIPYLGDAFLDYTMNGRVHNSMGNRHRWAAPHGCYRCRGDDHWVCIAVFNEEQWQGLCRALGNPAWTEDHRFADSLSRYHNQDELDRHLEDWTKEHDHYAVMHILQREGVPAGPVIDDRDAYNDPHLKERGFFQQLTHADCGTHFYPGLAWKASQTPNAIRTPPCGLGEHNDYVYREVLGISAAEYDELVKEGHIGTEPALDAT